MAKSSSTHRKKRDKISSKVPTKKSKTKSKSKGEKYRSKKARRRDDSLSGDSRSLSLDSSYSSEDDRRSRRARSRTRRDVKGSKKRARKRSYSSDSSEESPRPKKRKVSKKGRENEVKKRGRSREKVRRRARGSSVSSESWSCSTGQGGSFSNDEIESKKHKAEKRMREENDRNKVEGGSGRGRERSRSRSLHSHYSESQERVTGEGNGRRLRSVIAVSEEDNQGGRWLDEEGHKEEITYDHDDYPSCRSNDSNDGVSKREFDNPLHVAPEVIKGVESVREEEVVSDAKGINSTRDGNVMTDHVNENKISGESSNLKDDDLETILRQKALENLKRFRGMSQRTAVTGNQEEKKEASGAKAEMAQIESSKEDISEVNGQIRLAEETSVPPVKDSNCGNETVSAEQDVTSPTHQEPVAGKSKMVSTISVVDKPKLAAAKSMSGSLKNHPTLKRALASLEPPKEKLLVTESSVDNKASGTAQTVTQSSNIDGLDISKGSGSTAPEPSGTNMSDLQQDDAKDGSQFEQKTMSVMRGSEMVQVSYKVYIPKKAPALARRQLKR